MKVALRIALLGLASLALTFAAVAAGKRVIT